MKKILHLTLKKKWFDMIAREEKHTEFREIKPYWEKRLLNGYIDGVPSAKTFDEIHFTNGYGINKPFMRIEWKQLELGFFKAKQCFAISLGKILELRNWESDTPPLISTGTKK